MLRAAVALVLILIVFGIYVPANFADQQDVTDVAKEGWLPGLDYSYRPLLADLDEPRTFLSLGSLSMLYMDGPAVLLGVGRSIGLYRFHVDDPENESAQINVFALIRSQFDVEKVDPTENQGGSLVNTDFAGGLSFVRKKNGRSIRAKFYHKSSHLGDEYLLEHPDSQETRVNISFEALDIIFMQEWERLRVYGGGRAIVHSQPASLGKFQLQAGLEYFGKVRDLHRWVAGVDLKSWNESDWTPLWTAKMGVELMPQRNPLRVLLEFQSGASQYGQFTEEDVSYIGLTLDYAY